MKETRPHKITISEKRILYDSKELHLKMLLYCNFEFITNQMSHLIKVVDPALILLMNQILMINYTNFSTSIFKDAH